MNKINIGGNYESMAVNFIKAKGFVVVKINYRCKVGEIDIVALKESTLCFIEVKYRNDVKYGHPLMAVNKSKQNKIIKVANWFLCENPQYLSYDCSFDVIAILGEKITYLHNCFGVN